MKCYVVLVNFVLFKTDDPMVDKLHKMSLQEAISYIKDLHPSEIYNIWDTETGNLIQGKHPETGEIVELPVKRPLDTDTAA